MSGDNQLLLSQTIILMVFPVQISLGMHASAIEELCIVGQLEGPKWH
jgi:hypothetical protein